MRHRMSVIVALLMLLVGCGATSESGGQKTASPDAAATRFILSRDGDLWRLALPSKEFTRLTEIAPVAAAYHPSVSPDGTTIAYAYRAPIPTPTPEQPFVIPRTGISVAPVSGGIGEPAHSPLDGYDSIDQPAWAPDGATIYAHYQTLRFADDGSFVGSSDDIVAISPAQKTYAVLATNGMYPVPSPDGATLAFVRNPSQTDAHLILYNLKTKTEQKIVPNVAYGAMEAPMWSPDGKTIYFSISPLTGSAPPAPLRWFAADSASAHGLGWQVWSLDVASQTARQVSLLTFEDPRIVVSGTNLYLWTFVGLWQIDLAQTATNPELVVEPGDVWGISRLP